MSTTTIKATFNGNVVEVQAADRKKQEIPLQMKKDVVAAVAGGMPVKDAFAAACKAYGVKANKSMLNYPNSILHAWRQTVQIDSIKK